ncbi:MAG: hypothetical protein NTZ09_09875 [Candidatus Hydrogenedentes bacterium]|nr:hypothetical protein [Candidatus Hydrogenedentota bacterium]
MFKRHHFNKKTGKGAEQSGIRYLYCGLTGARFARSSRPKEVQTPHQPTSNPPPTYDLIEPSAPAEAPAAEEPHKAEPQDDSAPVQDSTPGQTIARLTAERDAARYERELEADYREALQRDLDVTSHQLKETQRRLMDLGKPSPPPSERECRLEHELEEARNRISELEAGAALSPLPTLPRGQEGMMDAFLQFVGLQERHDDSRT